jgi:hypothetical protein
MKFKCIFGWFEWNFAEVKKTNDFIQNRKEIPHNLS